MGATSTDVERSTGLSRETVASVVAILVLLVVASAGVWKADLRADTGLPIGAHDFIAYWAAFEVGVDGGDPYEPGQLQAAQQEIHPRYEQGVQRFWNPPWALTVLGPVLLLPFDVAVAVWLVLQIAGAVVATVLCWRLLGRTRSAPPPWVVALGFLFMPFLDGLLLGQMGVYVAVCLLGALVALREGRDVTAGLLIALLVAKPQTALLVLVLVGLHVIVSRRWAVISSAAVGVAMLVGSSVVLFPSVWAGWDPLGGSPTHWQSATIAGWVRGWLPAGSSGAPTWPIMVIPLLALLVTLPWIVTHARDLPWGSVPGLLTISVLCAPYAWVSDSMVLLVSYIAVLVAAVEHRRLFMLPAIVAIGTQVVALVIRGQEWSGHHHLIVVPLGLYVSHLIARAVGVYERLGIERAPGVQGDVISA